MDPLIHPIASSKLLVTPFNWCNFPVKVIFISYTLLKFLRRQEYKILSDIPGSLKSVKPVYLTCRECKSVPKGYGFLSEDIVLPKGLLERLANNVLILAYFEATIDGIENPLLFWYELKNIKEHLHDPKFDRLVVICPTNGWLYNEAYK